jgi:hypothetical protein
MFATVGHPLPVFLVLPVFGPPAPPPRRKASPDPYSGIVCTPRGARPAGWDDRFRVRSPGTRQRGSQSPSRVAAVPAITTGRPQRARVGATSRPKW